MDHFSLFLTGKLVLFSAPNFSGRLLHEAFAMFLYDRNGDGTTFMIVMVPEIIRNTFILFNLKIGISKIMIL